MCVFVNGIAKRLESIDIPYAMPKNICECVLKLSVEKKLNKFKNLLYFFVLTNNISKIKPVLSNH